jgi:hypothetical protein
VPPSLATATPVAARPPQSINPYEARGSEAHLRSLQTAVTELSRPLPLQRIAAIVAHATIEALGPQAVVIAVHEDDGLHLRGVHVAGLPDQTRHRLCAEPTPAPRLVREIQRFLRGAEPSPWPAMLAVLPISQGERRLGLLVLGRPCDHPLSNDDRTFLNVLTSLCALAMERQRMYADLEPTGPQLRVGDMEIDLEEQRVTSGSNAVALTPCEMRLLVFLAKPPGRVRSRREILQHLWRTEHVGDERACDAHVSNLRRKIEREPSRPERLITLRGHGYVLQPR